MDASVASLQLDMTNLINLLEHYLKGERYVLQKNDVTGEEKWQWVPTQLHLLNEEGVQFILIELQMYLNPNTFLTVLTDDDIQKIMERFHHRLVGLLLDRQIQFEMETAYIRPVVNTVTNVVWMALKRSSGDGRTLNAFTKTYKAIETHEVNKKRKWFW